jgi:hypothetical protein
MNIGTYNIRIENWGDWRKKSWYVRKKPVTNIIKSNDLDIMAI